MKSFWINLGRGFLTMIVSCFLAATAGAQSLDAIFTSQTTGEIDNINTVTGVSTTIATETGNWNGAAYNPQNGLIYMDNINETGFTPNAVITNSIYSFNPFNPGAGTTLVGTVAGQFAFTGAGFHNGLYYTIPTGSNQLIAYSVTGGAVTQVSTQTLGGLPANNGLSLGDIDFIGNTIYISGGTVANGSTTVSATYTLYSYADVSNVTTPVFAVTENDTGVGIAYDPNNADHLIMFNSDGTIETVNPLTGAESGSLTITGPANGAGAGDFTVVIVPEPRDYAIGSTMLLLALIMLHRALRPRLPQPCRIEV